MRRSSRRPSDPAYYIEDCWIFKLFQIGQLCVKKTLQKTLMKCEHQEQFLVVGQELDQGASSKSVFLLKDLDLS